MFSLEIGGQFFSNILKKAKEFKTNLPKYYNWKLQNFVRNCLRGIVCAELFAWNLSCEIKFVELFAPNRLRRIGSRGIENAKLNSEKSLCGIWNRRIWNRGIVRAELDCEIKTKNYCWQQPFCSMAWVWEFLANRCCSIKSYLYVCKVQSLIKSHWAKRQER